MTINNKIAESDTDDFRYKNLIHEVAEMTNELDKLKEANYTKFGKMYYEKHNIEYLTVAEIEEELNKFNNTKTDVIQTTESGALSKTTNQDPKIRDILDVVERLFKNKDRKIVGKRISIDKDIFDLSLKQDCYRLLMILVSRMNENYEVTFKANDNIKNELLELESKGYIKLIDDGVVPSFYRINREIVKIY